jgi:hypothetical protein
MLTFISQIKLMHTMLLTRKTLKNIHTHLFVNQLKTTQEI